MLRNVLFQMGKKEKKKKNDRIFFKLKNYSHRKMTRELQMKSILSDRYFRVFIYSPLKNYCFYYYYYCLSSFIARLLSFSAMGLAAVSENGFKVFPTICLTAWQLLRYVDYRSRIL